MAGRPLLDGIAVPSSRLLSAATERQGPSAMQVTTVGFDLAKQIFQVHGVGGDGRALVRKHLRRSEVLSFFSALDPCLIGMEARATAHH